MENIRVKDIAQKNERTLAITWTDNRTDEFDVIVLRQSCPCAVCIDEWTHEQILTPEHVAPNVRPLRIDSVGQYALSIQFNDGHRTGIYTFEMLRKLANKTHIH